MANAQHLVVSGVSGILEVFLSERSKVDSWIGWTPVSSRRSSGGDRRLGGCARPVAVCICGTLKLTATGAAAASAVVSEGQTVVRAIGVISAVPASGYVCTRGVGCARTKCRLVFEAATAVRGVTFTRT